VHGKDDHRPAGAGGRTATGLQGRLRPGQRRIPAWPDLRRHAGADAVGQVQPGHRHPGANDPVPGRAHQVLPACAAPRCAGIGGHRGRQLSGAQPNPAAGHIVKRLVDTDLGTTRLSVRDSFGLDSDLEVMAFAEPGEHVPEADPNYHFDPDTTLAILAGFSCNRRVLIQGMHGTGKSTHIEQVAARLNWPCIRVNLDGHISRLDLVGRDAIVLRDGRQVTEFKEGILPWALQRPMALVLDEYDAGRPEVMFVLQRILERDGYFTLLDQNRVIAPHSGFRLFATANSVGLGDSSGLYYGVQRLNHAQLDRWNIV